MFDNDNLQSKVTKATLQEYLALHCEDDSWDFKVELHFADFATRVELVRDVIGLATTVGGGHLVIGVDPKTYESRGLTHDHPQFDTTAVYKAIQEFVDDMRLVAAEYRVENPQWSAPRRFGIIYVAQATRVPFTKRAGIVDGKKGEQTARFDKGDTFLRRGAQTLRASVEDVVSLRERLEPGTPTAMPDAPAPAPARPPLECVLPPREDIVPTFVGRSTELQTLFQWFEDRRRSKWMLAGYGGKGKSSIAYEFASAIVDQAPEGYWYVIWLSAKRERFVEGSAVPVNDPDFNDLSTLLDAIASSYGFAEYAALDIDEKYDSVLDLLEQLPCLLVVDDVNSISSAHEDAIDFLVTAAARTRSKLLLTAREIPYGWSASSTEVGGLTPDDADLFIETRIARYRLDPQGFPPNVRRRLVQATEASPLYLEDLLRLCAVMPVSQAIERWKEKLGDAARAYAVSKEFETLSENAKRIVLACCLNDGPISFPELQQITQLTEEQLLAQLRSIQNLFLISTPQLSPDVQRFDIDANTRSLVLHVMAGKDLLEQVRRRYAAVSGELAADQAVGWEVRRYLRQAASLQALGRQEEALSTIREGLNKIGEHPDLVGQMGVIFARWRPGSQVTEARDWFQRAADLRCSRESIYSAWANLEISAKDWEAAAKAAEGGIRMCGPTMKLAYLAGLAHSMRGQALLRQFQDAKAHLELVAGDRRLREALRDPEALGPGEYEYNGRVLRALVLNCEALNWLGSRFRLESDYLDDLFGYLRRWVLEYGSDPKAKEAKERLEAKFHRSI